MKLIIMIALAMSVVGSIGYAQTASAPKPGSVDAVIAEIKNPVDWFTWGGDLRLRTEYFNNALTLSKTVVRHEQDYFRFRERLWLALQPVTNLNVTARITGEERDWMRPAFTRQFDNAQGGDGRYGIMDNAYLKWSNVFDQPLTLTAGRQDIQLGDPLNWWLVMDGTPYDGSWTFFFDSVRGTYNLSEIKNRSWDTSPEYAVQRVITLDHKQPNCTLRHRPTLLVQSARWSISNAPIPIIKQQNILPNPSTPQNQRQRTRSSNKP